MVWNSKFNQNNYLQMNIDFIVEKMRNHPVYMNMGAGKLSRRWKCNREDVYKAKEIVRGDRVKHTLPKILILDIETAPLLAYVYQTQVWNATIRDEAVISNWFCLTWSAKFLGEDIVYSDRCTPEEVMEENDGRIMKELWRYLNEADIVIAHNGNRFDIPNINTRFLLNNIGPTTPYKQIDTLKVARKQFGFTHNNLDALAHYFGIEGKLKTGFELWKRCMRGDESALIEMEEYNRHDVEILEEVYLHLRPWMKSHINVSLYNDSEELQCPHCGSTSMIKTDSFWYTHTGKYPVYKCKECGAHSKERKSIGKKIFLTSIPGR